MPLIRTLPALTLAVLCLSSAAQESRTAAAASTPASAPAGSPPMAVVGEWQGPFQDTKVLKLLDAEDGVACYFYVPANVPSNTVCTGRDACAIHYPSGIGTMSCVKVREPRATPKSATKVTPRR